VVQAVSFATAGALRAEAPRPSAPQPHGPLADILAKIPNDNPAAAVAALQELIKLGPKGVKDLADTIVEPGRVDDSKARFAFHGLALYVARPDAGPERLMVCEAVCGLLADKYPPAVKGFFLRQLRFIACPEAVPAVSGFLLDEELSEYAAQTLVSTGGEAAAAALRQALPSAKGKPRITIIQDLGVLRDTRAAPDLLKAAGDADVEVRLAALFALANIGDAAATGAIQKASEAELPYERAKATDALLALARRLGEEKHAKEAEQIYRALWTSRAGPQERHVRCAAIAGLAAVLGAGAMDDLVAAIKGDDPQVRAAAVEAAVAMPGEDVTGKWIALLAAPLPATRAEVVALLARRGGPAARDAVLDATKDKDESVRAAAVTAAAAFSDEQVAAALIGLLASENSAEQQAARQSLARMPGGQATQAVAAAMAAPATPAALRKELLGVLAARGAGKHVDVILAAARESDAGVRSAALESLETLADEKDVPALVDILVKAAPAEKAAAEKALAAACGRAENKDACAERVVAAMAGADAAARAALLRVLGRTGGAKALEAVRQAVGSPDAQVQDAAVRALCGWPDGSVAPDLLAIAKGAAKPAQQVLALRGYIRLAGVPPERPVAEKLKMYQEAMTLARLAEKRLVLGALADVKSPAALDAVLPLLADETLKEEAAAAAVKIGKSVGGAARAEVKAAMQKVLEVSKNDGTRKDAEGVLRKLK
jgi:HEAT repeat protein